MSIDNVQKKLKEEFELAQAKLSFINDFQTLIKKHKLDLDAAKSLISEASSSDAPKRGRKPGTKKAVPGKKAVAKRKAAKKPRPMRKFKNTATGEVITTAAPQVNKTVKQWAADLKVDWRTLEV